MFKAIDKWLLGYLRSVIARPRGVKATRHLFVAVCDHFEPFRGGADKAVARELVRDWVARYRGAVAGFRDADGQPPRHTFFYPQEEYDEVILDELAAFCRNGYGEVEIHLHHRHDTPEGFREKLITFRDLLYNRHGLLGEERGGVRGSPASPVRYAFIHGNWALCNSRPDGDWCGVNEELGILADTGCYADFTFPSAPSPTQPRLVNSIYYAKDRPGRPRGADGGELVSCRVAGLLSNNQTDSRDSSAAVQQHDNLTTTPLLLITGPLALNWHRRKWGLLPRLENAEITGANPPAADRIRLWVRQQIHVRGRPDWVFVKLHTHGCVPANQEVLLGQLMRRAHTVLQQEYNDGRVWQLHYVTAREMANLVKAAEADVSGDPVQYRDYRVGPLRGRSRDVCLNEH
jgi:hypothetical protein